MTLEQLAKQGKRAATYTTAATINRSISQARNANLRNSFIDCDHLKHRNEVIESRNGINYIDDSGARTVSATYFTLSDTTTPTIWITIGGCDDYEELIPVVRQCVVAIICIGEYFDNIDQTFGGMLRGGVLHAHNMSEAIAAAEKIAVSGQNILFSPAEKSLNSEKLVSDFVSLSVID